MGSLGTNRKSMSYVILHCLFLLSHNAYGVVLWGYQKGFSFFLKTSLVFSREISLVCRLKCSYSCFSSHFYFLVIFVLLMFVLSVLFLVVAISLPSCFFMPSSSRCINALTLSLMPINFLPPSFLDTYSQSTSSLGSWALCASCLCRNLNY